MPANCTQPDCTLCPGADLPATLHDLRQITQVAELGHDLETLALIGTSFEDALFTTRNGGALISGRGGYGPLQTSNMPFRISRGRVTMRLAAGSQLRLARSAALKERALPGSVIAVDHGGHVHHRVQYVSPNDHCVAQALETIPERSVPLQSPPVISSNVVSLAAIRAARMGWDRADAGIHLNGLLRDGGAERRNSLPHMGRERAWRVIPEVLPSFLAYLCDKHNSFARMVPAAGMLQASAEPIARANQIGSLFMGQGGQSVFSLDCAQICHAWVVASRRYWQLELYDGAGKALAVLADDPHGTAWTWRDLLASLPRAA